MRLEKTRQFFADVYGCPRCGEDHTAEARLMFMELERPDPDGFDVWAFCPQTNEPVLANMDGD